MDPKMAFTLAHMSAALPFYQKSRWFNFDALLIGTIMPDLPYYLPLLLGGGSQFAIESHGWLGLISYCVPRGLALFILWYWWLKPALNAIIQPWLSLPFLQQPGDGKHSLTDRRSQSFQSSSSLKARMTFGVAVILSLFIGSITHLIWDGITHPDGFIALQVSWLQYSLNLPYVGMTVMARVLQYLTSIIGLTWLAIFSWQQARIAHEQSSEPSDLSSIGGQQSYQPLLFNKKQSLLILALVGAIPVIWGLSTMLEMSQMFVSNNYVFFVVLLLGFFKRLGFTFLIFTMAYHLLNILKYGQLKSQMTPQQRQ